MYACSWHACMDLFNNPNPETYNRKQSTNKKTLILATEHAQNIKELQN